MAESALAEFIRLEREAILDRWIAAIRQQPVAREIDEATLRDSVPVLLDRIARMAEELAEGPIETGPEDLSANHAKNRLELGYSVEELVVDHVALRQTLITLLAERGPNLTPADVALVHHAIDRSLVDTLRYFIEARDRKLRALERISTELLGAADVDAMLDALLVIFVESVPAADTATLLIREGDHLVVRGTRGLDREDERGMSIAIGDGFAGRIAMEQRPLSLSDAASDPGIRSPGLRTRGVRALYGVPLVRDGVVVGVATMGSIHAYEFAEDDMLLLRGLANRAAAVIAQAQLVERLEDEARLREQLVAIVGHDLRTPLSALTMGAGHLQSMPDLPPVALRVAARMLRSAERMRRIIEELLDFTRARGGAEIPVAPIPMRLDELARDTVQEIEMAHPAQHVALYLRGPVEGTWDPERLRQVLANLLENAITHGRGAAVRVVVAEEGGHASVCVHNAGEPIPPGELPLLFEPFRKSAASRRGLGLGLYIAREVVRAHGGEITLRSSDADGTSFTVRLPL